MDFFEWQKTAILDFLKLNLTYEIVVPFQVTVGLPFKREEIESLGPFFSQIL